MDVGTNVADIMARLTAESAKDLTIASAKMTQELIKQLLLFLIELAKQRGDKVGEISLKKILKSNDEIKIFNMPKEHMEAFEQAAEKYHITFAKFEEGENFSVFYKLSEKDRVQTILEALHLDKIVNLDAHAILGGHALGEDDSNANQVRGVLLDHGEAPYEFNEKNSQSYFAKIETDQGMQTLWGVDLERAIEESQVQVGQGIILENKGSQPVTITQDVRDKEGNVIDQEKKEVHRNIWEAQPLNERHQEDIPLASIESQEEHVALNKSQSSTPSKEKEDNNTKKITGTLRDHGEAPYQFNEKKGESYFVKIETDQGMQTLWGVGLEDAIKESQVELDQRCSFENKGRQPVTITQDVLDKDGNVIRQEEKEVHRNIWEAQPLNERHQEDPSLEATENQEKHEILNTNPTPSKTKEDNNTNRITGTLREHGKAPYEFNDKLGKSYFVKVETDQGVQTFWGLGLENAIKESQLEIGQQCSVENKDRQPVTIIQDVRDKNKALSSPESQDHSVALEAKTPDKTTENTASTQSQEKHVGLNTNTNSPTPLRAKDDNNTKKITGTLIKHGKAPFEFNEKNSQSYFVKIETDQGVKTFWGVDLKRAIKENNVQVGQCCSIENKGSQPVTIKQDVLDKEGNVIRHEKKEVHRNNWDARPTLSDKCNEIANRHKAQEREAPKYKSRQTYTNRQTHTKPQPVSSEDMGNVPKPTPDELEDMKRNARRLEELDTKRSEQWEGTQWENEDVAKVNQKAAQDDVRPTLSEIRQDIKKSRDKEHEKETSVDHQDINHTHAKANKVMPKKKSVGKGQNRGGR